MCVCSFKPFLAPNPRPKGEAWGGGCTPPPGPLVDRPVLADFFEPYFWLIFLPLLLIEFILAPIFWVPLPPGGGYPRPRLRGSRPDPPPKCPGIYNERWKLRTGFTPGS